MINLIRTNLQKIVVTGFALVMVIGLFSLSTDTSVSAKNNVASVHSRTMAEFLQTLEDAGVGLDDPQPAAVSLEYVEAIERSIEKFANNDPSVRDREFVSDMNRLERMAVRELEGAEEFGTVLAIQIALDSHSFWTDYASNDSKNAQMIDWGEIIKADVFGFVNSIFEGNNWIDALKDAVYASLTELLDQIFG